MSEFIIECEYDFDEGWIPGEQREEVVRCEGCKWMSKDTVHYKACYRLHAIEFMVEPDGFCKWGERRER